MRVIDRKKEQEQAHQAAWDTQKQIKREMVEREQKEIEQTISIDLDRGAFDQLLQTMKNGGLNRVYGREMVGGYFFLHEQIVSAQKFFELSLRDRNQIDELIVDEYVPNLRASIKLSIRVEPEFIGELQREASGLRVDYMAYLRAIFYTRASDINTEQRAIAEESQRAMLYDTPQRMTVLITKEVRDKLEERYGKPQYDWVLSYTKYKHSDMLQEFIYESFGLKPVKRQ